MWEAKGKSSFKVLNISPHRVPVVLLTMTAVVKQSLSPSQMLLFRIPFAHSLLAKLSPLQLSLLTFWSILCPSPGFFFFLFSLNLRRAKALSFSALHLATTGHNLHYYSSLTFMTFVQVRSSTRKDFGNRTINFFF